MRDALRWLAVILPGLTGAGALAAPATAAFDPPAHSAEDDCLRYASRLGSVHESDCRGQSFRHSGHLSVRQQPILVRDFAAREETAPRVLVVGGIHGDELSSVSIVFGWMRELRLRDSQDFHWRLTPSMNPDGLFLRDAERTNANGVDLNRNFPTPNWEDESTHYWVHRTGRSPRRYPGPSPLSEPESRWLYDEIEQFRPDVIVAIHAPYGIVDFDGPSNPPNKLGHLYLNLLGTYPGSLGNYAGVQRGIPVVTVELPSAGIMPTLQQQHRIWQDLVSWLHKNLRSRASRAEAPPEPR